MSVKFPSMGAYWEYVKAQSAQTVFVWNRFSDEEKDKIRAVSHALVANLNALASGVNGEVEGGQNAEGRKLVTCDERCLAYDEPRTLDEYKAAYEHWSEHRCLNGCSHGR